MKKILSIIGLLICTCLVGITQNTPDIVHYKDKYFEYREGKSMMMAYPLFDSSLEKKGMIRAEFDYSQLDWINQFSLSFLSVVKKYYTKEEMKQMILENRKSAAAEIYASFDYDGNIKFLYFIYNKRIKKLLTTEKLYQLYLDIMKLKIDTSQLNWFVEGRTPTPEQKKKIYTTTNFYFFNKSNCP